MLDPHTILVLIGLRGSGKSTLASMLARRLDRYSMDLDDLSPGYLGEKTAGASIQKHGEPAFRRAELQALLEVLKNPPPRGLVLALGGGTPTAPGVSELLATHRASGKVRVVYLRASEQTLRARLGQMDNANRPTLTGTGVLDEIGFLLNLRDTLYKSTADVVVLVDDKSTEQVADEILARV